MLDSVHRLKRLNFTKAPWPEIRKEFRTLDWNPMCEGKKARKRNLINQDEWDPEQQLKSENKSVNKIDEANMKYNPKYFFIFAKTRQKTRPRIGPFLDLSTCQPNPNPNFAASLLSDQYKSVFVQPRQDWLVDH